MSQTSKTIHTGLRVLGDTITEGLNATTGVFSSTLYIASKLTVAAGGAEINGPLDVFDGTSEVTYQNGIFRVSLVGGTTLFRLTDTDGMDINNDVAIGVGKTLKVDNIYKADAGLGLLLVEGVGFESGVMSIDTVKEKTTNNGVRIELLKIEDNTLDLISGTEIIIEENVRIRDGKALEVSAIYEADLSADITFYSRTVINSSFEANYGVKFGNITSSSNHEVLLVDNTGVVSSLPIMTVLTSPSPDKLFINGDIQLNSGPGQGGHIDLTNGFGHINNVVETYSDASIHNLMTTVYAGGLYLLMYGQTNHPPATEIKGSYLLSLALDDSSNTVRVRTTLLGSTGSAVTIGYADDNNTSCSITVKSPASLGIKWTLLRIG